MIKTYYSNSHKSITEIDISGAEYDPGIFEIEGVVSPESQCAHRREGYIVHIFSFAAWRLVNNTDIINQKLLVLRPVDSSIDYLNDIKPYSVLKITARLDLKKVRAVFETGEVVNDSENNDLKIHALELSKPIEKSTTFFGKLVLDKSINWYSGKGVWNGIKVDLNFPIYEIDDISIGLDIAQKIWEKQIEWKQKIEDYAVEKLLFLKNESWLEDGEKEITADQFKKLMTLESITFEPDGEFIFWYNDGDLFWGHSIQVGGNLNEGLTNAGI